MGGYPRFCAMERSGRRPGRGGGVSVVPGAAAGAGRVGSGSRRTGGCRAAPSPARAARLHRRGVKTRTSVPGIAVKLQTCQRLLAPAASKCWYSGMRHRLQPGPGPPARPPRRRARPGPAPGAAQRGGARPGWAGGSCSRRAHAWVGAQSHTCPRRVLANPSTGGPELPLGSPPSICPLPWTLSHIPSHGTECGQWWE